MHFFLGKDVNSNREGFLLTWTLVGPPLVAESKMHLIRQDHMYDAPQRLPLPRLINLLVDRKEERDVLLHNTWVNNPMMKILREFEASLEKHPPIEVGTPDPYLPPASPGRDGSGGSVVESGWLAKTG